MKSMTGFGRAELASRQGKLSVEISSLNNRYLDFSFKASRQFLPLELKAKELVTEQLSRGKINVCVSLEESDSTPDRYLINTAAVKAYYRQLMQLKKTLKVTGDITIADLIHLPDVARPDREGAESEQFWKLLATAIKRALKQVLAMRQSEGQAMAKHMKGILDKMPAQIADIEKLTRGSVIDYRTRLSERVNELLESHNHNSVRLEEEIALFAEKSDVSEECGRLRSHIDQFSGTMKLSEPVGKRLNFILQEMNRESNTIGSKCANFSISSTAIRLKEEIEQIREMVQNVE